MNLTELLENTAVRWPQKPALVEDGSVITYGELAWHVGGLAQEIRALHIDKGSRVGLAFPNGITYIALTCLLYTSPSPRD